MKSDKVSGCFSKKNKPLTSSNFISPLKETRNQLLNRWSHIKSRKRLFNSSLNLTQEKKKKKKIILYLSQKSVPSNQRKAETEIHVTRSKSHQVTFKNTPTKIHNNAIHKRRASAAQKSKYVSSNELAKKRKMNIVEAQVPSKPVSQINNQTEHVYNEAETFVDIKSKKKIMIPTLL